MHRYRIGDRLVQVFVVLSSATAVFWIALVAISNLVNRWGIFNSPTGRLPRGFAPPDEVTGFYVLDALLAGRAADRRRGAAQPAPAGAPARASWPRRRS